MSAAIVMVTTHAEKALASGMDMTPVVNSKFYRALK
jgi:hypothetical protein